MRPTTAPAVCRALAAALLSAVFVGSPLLAATAAPPAGAEHTQQAMPLGPAPTSYAGPCTDDLGVTVVVDFRGLGGATVVRCAPGGNGQPFSGTGLDAFQAAGINLAGTAQDGLSVVCRVNGRPGADEPLAIPGNEGYTEQCQQMPPASAFWSYWQADNNGGWVFSNNGVKSSTARAGGFEGLSFSLNSTSAPPRTAPSRPAPEPEPTPQPSPSDPTPSPPAPSDPTPSQPAPGTPNPPALAPGAGSGGGGGGADASGRDENGGGDESGGASDQDGSAAPGSNDGSNDPGQANPEAENTNEAAQGTSSNSDTDLGDLAGALAAAGGLAGETTDADGTQPSDGTQPADGIAPDQANTTAPSNPELSSAALASPTDGGGPRALWATFGILLLLGVVAALVARRGREPFRTHQVDP